LAERKRRRRVNINEPGHAHELTFSCYHGFKFLRAERTCLWLADSIEKARKEFSFSLWAYVFMPNHAHLLIWPKAPVYDIAVIRQAMKSPVARRAIAYMKSRAPHWLAKVSRERGDEIEHLFWQSGGGYDRNMISSKALMASIDYLHMNPVRKELVETAADWKWSSAAWYIKGEAIPISVDPIPAEWLESSS
jgi:putative transposase